MAEYKEYLNRIRSSLLTDPIKGYKNDVKLTCDIALEEILSIRCDSSLDGEQLAILDWLSSYIKAL